MNWCPDGMLAPQKAFSHYAAALTPYIYLLQKAVKLVSEGKSSLPGKAGLVSAGWLAQDPDEQLMSSGDSCQKGFFSGC